jgi:hypothetical protein
VDLLETASRSLETSTQPQEFIAQGDRVLVVGVATGRVKATNKPFEDDWIFAITVQDGKLTSIREYVDTQALARASGTDTSRASSAIGSEAAQRAGEARQCSTQAQLTVSHAAHLFQP